MFLAERMNFLPDVFQMIAIALVLVINGFQINRLHQFRDTLFMLGSYQKVK